MIRKFIGWLALASLMALSACGGGSSSEAGTPPFDDGTTTGGTTTETSYTITVELQRSGASTTSISSTETVQAVATVKSSTGDAVSGVVVSFAETNASLVSFAPSSATALTDANGVAKVDVAAATTSSTGATTILANTSIADVSFSASTSFQIKAGSTDSTPATPSAINFVSATPSGTALAIKGAGGNGRSQSGILTFRVVDGSNAPIEGATVNFALNPVSAQAGVTLNITSAVSDSEGSVTTTVQSGSLPTTVVVTATAAANPAASVQSDTIIVSNGVATQEGFEIVAAKYNLDGRLTGDETDVTARVRDAFGNPVADGLAVSFTTDFGVIANSNLGGCLTVDGACSVKFRVQNPRGNGVATVVATANVATNTPSLSASLQINMPGGTSGVPLAVKDDLSSLAGKFTLQSCKQTFELALEDSDTGRSVAAATTIKVLTASTNISASIKSGSPVADSPDLTPTPFTIEVDVSSTDLRPLCNAAGTVAEGGFLTLQYQTPGGSLTQQRFSVFYPQ